MREAYETSKQKTKETQIPTEFRAELYHLKRVYPPYGSLLITRARSFLFFKQCEGEM
jgi:hypothetical protein